MRDLTTLPKAHLHLHFTGSLKPEILADLATESGIRLPASLTDTHALQFPANQRGWFRFQRHYDAARAVVRSEMAMRRIIRQAAIDDAAEGSVRLEIQVDPTSYAPYVGGITPALEIIIDEARQASAATGVEVAVIVAASRIRHPLDARTLARLAAKYASDAPGGVVAFGLSNDERAGDTAEFATAFRLARQAGLPGVPHGGELLGPDHIRQVIAHLNPRRLGHGVRSCEDPQLLEMLAADGIALEVCPASNVSLGVYSGPEQVPLRTLLTAGVDIALGADDPLLFRSRLVDQYLIARKEHGLSDSELAELARASVRASLASAKAKRNWLEKIDIWLR